MTELNHYSLNATSLPTYSVCDREPYYILPPPSAGASYDISKVLALCSALNRLGYESYVVGVLSEGHYWSPLLTSVVQAEHFKAGRKPIVLNASAVDINPLKLGVHVRLAANTNIPPGSDAQITLCVAPLAISKVCQFVLPMPEMDRLNNAIFEQNRSVSLIYLNGYKDTVRSEHQNLAQIKGDFAETLEKTLEQLRSAKILYLYEWTDLSVIARLCGCAVVFVPNALLPDEALPSVGLYGMQGLAWGLDPQTVEKALAEVADYRLTYARQMDQWQRQLLQFIQETQQLTQTMTFDHCWPKASTDTLPGIYSEEKDLADRADRIKWSRLQGQYQQWVARSSLREIDAQIYAEYLMSGRAVELSVIIDQRADPLDLLADTLDSLSAVLGQPKKIYIASGVAPPEEFEPTSLVAWVKLESVADLTRLAKGISSKWVLLVRAGTILTPRALMEWMLAPLIHVQAQMIYADEDIRLPNGKDSYPYFKPDINVELLRCTNYLGDALLLKSDTWLSLNTPLFGGELYAAALKLLELSGRSAFGHIDSVLFHAGSGLSSHTENAEFESAQRVLITNPLYRKVTPLDRLGTWLVQFANPDVQPVSLVVPTGLQTGYLRGLLLGLERCPDANLDEIILICQEEQRDEVQNVISGLNLPSLRILTQTYEIYNHAEALNLGVREARNDIVLIADDDTEPLHRDWLTSLLGLLAQGDVGCVSPRLLSIQNKQSKVVGGPVILGMGGAQASYTGEEQRLEESGVYSRLQLTQDVSTVSGHCFVFRKADWAMVDGFDSVQFGFTFPVLDFCLKLAGVGKRHVWTPLVGFLHHGGKTVETQRRNVQRSIVLADAEFKERTNLMIKWSQQLANDPCYNRHLSLIRPFDIEADIVIDWQPKRHDRPRALAVPLHSGAGQYRVIEPLNALQDAGLAQTSVVMPLSNSQHRLLQPLELLRAAPDRLILQHSVDDGQLLLIESFKRVAPHIKIVQMVDDLFGEVPEKHPSRQFQAREGHQRMMQALILSDRLVVTTQPLIEYYGKYVQDVYIVPNTLAHQWQGLRKSTVAREKLRIGWVGAAQHRGDLELITDVVRDLSAEVDWVFMGMCTDEIKPHIKEFHSFVSIADYPEKMASLDLDIAIAPLENNLFNRCKSNLRLLEYGAMGWPVVCSDVFPYQADGAPVLRVNNDKDAWVQAIRRLFDDEFRKKQADLLHHWVQTRYTLSIKTSSWMNAIFG